MLEVLYELIFKIAYRSKIPRPSPNLTNTEIGLTEIFSQKKPTIVFVKEEVTNKQEAHLMVSDHRHPKISSIPGVWQSHCQLFKNE